MVLDLTFHGILIRPLSVYQGEEFRVYRVKGANRSLGEKAILKGLKYVAHGGYDFEKVLFLGLVMIPTRLVRGSAMKSNEIGYDRSKRRLKPKGKLQKIAYFVCRVIAVMTLMKDWSTILALISRDKWLIFTYRVMDKVGYEKIENEVVTFDEFVEAIEKELVSMKVYELSRATMEILFTERRYK
jgi:hypothetical protein